ncbi:SWIM zinc finger family protein [soil metagenome]
MILTLEQIVSLAPDEASIKAGRGLANPMKWPVTGRSAEAAWGECQGSGSKPYQVSIDLSGPAFRCTCPSRKFPCKHGIGLMLLALEKPEAVKAGTAPPWVADWLAARGEKAQKKAVEKKETVADPAAVAKRAGKRLDQMREGGEELARWLADQVRTGIATYPQQPASYFAGLAARMVDAQLPGLANEVSRLKSLIFTGDGWPQRVLEQLGRMYLLTEGLRHFEKLDGPLQADLRAQLGWALEKDEVLASGQRVEDAWCVLGQSFRENDKLWERRTWLAGQASGKQALLLDFSHGNRNFAVSMSAGTKFRAALVYYPAAFPLRALLSDEPVGASPLVAPFPAAPDFSTAFGGYADALAANPWLVGAPLAVRQVTPIRRGERWIFRDETGAEVPLRMPEQEAWSLLALSGGRPVQAFGEWSAGEWYVLGVWAGEFQSFQAAA